jgi:outer membrane protein TolC
MRRLSLTQTQRTQLATVVQVYKALGGGWTPDRSRILGQE